MSGEEQGVGSSCCELLSAVVARHNLGCTGSSAGLGFTPRMLPLASFPAPVPSPGKGAAGLALGSLSPRPAGLLLAWEPPGFGEARAAAHQLPGLLRGVGAGPGWQMRAALGIALPALDDPWEGPGLTEAVAKSRAALKWRRGNAEREEREGRGRMGSSQQHGGTGGRLGWRKAAEPTQGQAPGRVP